MKVLCLAVGMWYFSIRFLEKLLLASMMAAAALGPKAGMPALSSSSTMPRARGSSGATTTKSMWLSTAQSTMAFTSVAAMGTHWARAEMPPLPGAQ